MKAAAQAREHHEEGVVKLREGAAEEGRGPRAEDAQREEASDDQGEEAVARLACGCQSLRGCQVLLDGEGEQHQDHITGGPTNQGCAGCWG